MLEKGDDMLKETLTYAVKFLNKRMKVTELKSKYFPREDRTLLMNIVGKDVNMGLMVDSVANEILLVAPDNIPKPTVTAVLSEDTFWLMIMGKTSIATSFFDRTHPVSLEGEATLRDMKIFTAIEYELRNIFEEMWRK